jgi:hypothetical protein
MRREHHGRALRNFLEFRYEYGPALLQVLYDVAIVHDLLAYIHRWAVGLQGFLDGDHGAIYAGAIAAGSSEHNLLRAALL